MPVKGTSQRFPAKVSALVDLEDLLIGGSFDEGILFLPTEINSLSNLRRLEIGSRFSCEQPLYHALLSKLTFHHCLVDFSTAIGVLPAVLELALDQCIIEGPFSCLSQLGRLQKLKMQVRAVLGNMIHANPTS